MIQSMIVRLKYCDQHEEPHHRLYNGHLLLSVTVLQKSRKHPILPAFQTRCNLKLVSEAKMELAHPGLRQPVLSCQLQYFCRCAYNLATQMHSFTKAEVFTAPGSVQGSTAMLTKMLAKKRPQKLHKKQKLM